MATLALAAAGSAIGGALLPGGISALGASITGAAIGQAVGSIAGSFIDQALSSSLTRSSGESRIVEGPRLSDLKISGSTEGTPIARTYGRMRLAGHLIWSTRFEEEVIKTTETTGGGGSSGGGKGIFGGSGSGSSQPNQTVTRIEYRYYANVAYALCEGEITRLGRIWADGKELNQSEYNIRLYRGTEDQVADSLIESKEGTDQAPSYRGTAYVVFERMPLGRFGNRLPQLNFEVFRGVDDFEEKLRAITIIPAAGEFVYETQEVIRTDGGISESENVNTSQGGSDWSVALDGLEEQLPNVKTASIIVAWFGDDLRIGQCLLQPRVDRGVKTTQPYSWSVTGIARSAAVIVSKHDGLPAFGGTPTDDSVVAAIKDLKARGYKVTFYPFILMDIPAGNTLPNPYDGTTGQPVYPWRGQITISPAAGQPGSPDKTAAAAAQVASFVGAAANTDFSISGETVIYTGPSEWTLRRMVLHYAHLCEAAGGVDAFLLGSEYRGASQVREGASSYPFVDALVTLASDVKSVLSPGTLLSYGADWSEYFGHQPTDGSNDVYFHLDPLWSSNDIDAVAIDNWWPLSDWRDGDAHLDAQAGVSQIYEIDYLKNNITGGEGYDFFYASIADRKSQTRTSITDGLGKPWVFRYKDITSWWQNQHFNRPAGIEDIAPTSWVPESKPFWFTELGCPAIDKGSNEPNAFVDPKSAQSTVPHFSRQTRDDLIQRRHIQAFHDFYNPAHDEFEEASNPVSSVYSDRMVDIDHIYVYTWDARPYPAFPYALGIWSDGENWDLGHWLTGRMAGGPLGAVVAQIMADFGFTKSSSAGLTGHLDGYVIDRIMSARSALQPLQLTFFFDAFESGGLVQFAQRGAAPAVAELTPDDLAVAGDSAPLFQLTRGQETELPVSAKITFVNGNGDYRQAAVEARRLTVLSSRVAVAEVPVAMGQAQAQAIAESWLQDSWAARESASLSLPPSLLALEPTDTIVINANGRNYPLRIVEIGDAYIRSVDARSIEPEIYVATRTTQRVQPLPAPSIFGPALAVFMDLPLLRSDAPDHIGFVAAHQAPWPGSVAFHRSAGDAGFSLNTLVNAQATLGVTETNFFSGPTGRYDNGNILRVKLDNGTLESVSELDQLGGVNAAALKNQDGDWEIFQFRTASLVSEGVYDLSVLLRGQAGTEAAMRDHVPAGARFVLLDSGVAPVDMTPDQVGLAFNWKYGPSNKDISDLSYSDQTHAFIGVGLRPFSPIHIRGLRTAPSDDVEVSWKRRTRLGGDNWESLDVPLGETDEAYEVDILDGGNAVRTLTSSTAAVTYTAADQATDFGPPQSNYTLKVYQISSVIGRGTPRERTINV